MRAGETRKLILMCFGKRQVDPTVLDSLAETFEDQLLKISDKKRSELMLIGDRYNLMVRLWPAKLKHHWTDKKLPTFNIEIIYVREHGKPSPVLKSMACTNAAEIEEAAKDIVRFQRAGRQPILF